MGALFGAPLLAFQVLDGVGWAARAVWTWRMLHQWLLSEKHEKSVLPPSFWSWSLLGSALDLAYLFHRRDPVFVSGTLVNACIYARNLAMSRRPAASANQRPISANRATAFQRVLLRSVGW